MPLAEASRASTLRGLTRLRPTGQPPKHAASQRLEQRSAPPPLAGAGMIGEQAWAEIEHFFSLSGRELQVLKGVFDRHKESVIADELNISRHTVHTYSERLYVKLAARGRTEMILRVVEHTLPGQRRNHAEARQRP